jgi:hypothetical protein
MLQKLCLCGRPHANAYGGVAGGGVAFMCLKWAKTRADIEISVATLWVA